MSSKDIPIKKARRGRPKSNTTTKKFVTNDQNTSPPKKRKYRRRDPETHKMSQQKKKIDPAMRKSLEYLWEQTDKLYFTKRTPLMIDNINQVHQILCEPQEDGLQKFSNFDCHLSFENLISPSYGKTLKDSNLIQANFENLIDLFRLSTLTEDQLDLNLINLPNIKQEFEAWYRNAPQKDLKKNTKKQEKYYLAEERIMINRTRKLLGLNQSKKVSPSSDLYQKSLDKELEDLDRQYQKQRQTNCNRFEEVKRKCFNEVRQLRKKLIGPEDHERPNERQVEMKYLREVLIELENAQLSESIKYVIAASKLENQDFVNYCLAMDEALFREVVWVTESELAHLESIRKSPIGCLTEITTTELVYSKPDREIGWREIFEDKLNRTSSHKTRKIILAKNNEYGMCHFCRKIEQNKYLHTCRYNSKQDGFPDKHPNNIDPLANEMIGHKDAPFNYEFSKKRNLFSFYMRKQHNLVCERKFCELCLVSWFATEHNDIKSDWKCPFCCGTCYCTRCVRNSNMLKIAEYYNKQGGSFDDAKRDSLFEKFLFKYDHQQLNQFYSNIEILIPVYNERSEEISEVLSDSEDTKKYKKKIKLKNNVKKLKEKVEETLEKEKKCHYNLIIEIQAFRDKLEEAENTLPPEEKESVNAKRKLDFDHSIEPAEEKKIKTNSSSPKKCDSKKSSTSKDEICYPMRELSYLTLTCLGREKSESHLIPIEQ